MTDKVWTDEKGVERRAVEIVEEYDTIDASLSSNSLIYNYIRGGSDIGIEKYIENYERSLKENGFYEIKGFYNYPSGNYVYDTSFKGNIKDYDVDFIESLKRYARDKQLDHILFED